MIVKGPGRLYVEGGDGETVHVADLPPDLAYVEAERDRARDLAAALEQRLTLAEKVVEAGRALYGYDKPGDERGDSAVSFMRVWLSLGTALAAYDEATR